MSEKLEALIGSVYSLWKRGQHKEHATHPDEEVLSCFLEGRLIEAEATQIKAHLITCESCMESLVFNVKAKVNKLEDVPASLILAAKELLASFQAPSLLEIILKFKEKFVTIVNTSGDILLGQELVPAGVLRSRSIKDFQEEVVIMKDFEDIRVEVKIENKGSAYFNLHITVKDRETHKAQKGLRVSLFKENLELESYLTDAGLAHFEHVPLGKYSLEITSLDRVFASVMIAIEQ